MLKADLHVHTSYSMDCNTPLEKVIECCLRKGVNCVAIADHGTAAGGLKLKELAPFTVIVAEEILTPHGEIMGMFLEETIPSGLSVEQTLASIKAQGGLVCLPHPFDAFRSSALDNRVIERIADQVDIIEVFNARSPWPRLLRSSAKADSFADKFGLAKSAGSDAHIPAEIGNTYVEMPEFNDKDGFLRSLKQGKICGRSAPLRNHFYSLWTRIRNRL